MNERYTLTEAVIEIPVAVTSPLGSASSRLEMVMKDMGRSVNKRRAGSSEHKRTERGDQV